MLIVLCNPFNILFLFQCRTDLYVWCILLQSRKYIVLQQMQLQSKWSGAILFISTTSLSQWISFIRPICYFHSGCILLCPDIRSIIHFTGFRFVPTSWASLPPEHRVLLLERNRCEQLYSGLIAFQASGRMPISTGRLKNAEVSVKNPTASLSGATCVPNKSWSN